MSRQKNLQPNTESDIKDEIKAIVLSLLSIGLSQKTLAESLNVSNAVISLLKQGKYNTSSANLKKYYESFKAINDDKSIDKDVEIQPIEVESSFADWLLGQLELHKITPAILAEKAKLSVLTINYIVNRTTSNPQQGTRRKIESALQEITKNVSEAAPIDTKTKKEIFSGLPYVNDEIIQVPNKKGIYVIHDRRGYPTYIGKGDVQSRLKSHKEHKAFLDERVANTFSYVILQEGDSKDARQKADAEALWLENLIAKVCGNTVLLNKKLITDLSDSD